MSNIAIRVENLSKQYKIGARRNRHDSLTEHIFHAAKSLLNGGRSSDDNYIWALKDVSFDIKHGEVVGFIGKNGAGKSTLLKLLSRITQPTSGRGEIYGRVGSLLEVGTGFHGELTGRENIYLNGAILGMMRWEIDKKFDEIVAFSEIEKFLDTPVKHYSSGMYVRLAFAVAAHLEPEILVVDEVLAVGDAQFQKKCLGKMENVAKEGRTVLFVSHNMQSVAQLTERCILLANGGVVQDAETSQVFAAYLESANGNTLQRALYHREVPRYGNYLEWARVHTSHSGGLHYWGKPIEFEFGLHIDEPYQTMCFSFQVVNSTGQPVTHHWLFDSKTPFGREKGFYRLRCKIPKYRLYLGVYTIKTWLSVRRSNSLNESLDNICQFEVTMGKTREEYDWQPNACAYVEEADWDIGFNEKSCLTPEQ